MNERFKRYYLQDNGTFPNSPLPVVHYKDVLKLPLFFAAADVTKKFAMYNWTNNWRGGIYTFHHYHSITHEALGVCKGKTMLQLGGDDGMSIEIEKGDVLIIPAGVAHKNLGKESDVVCVGGYPDGNDFDMNYGREGERPGTDYNITLLPMPSTDPVYGLKGSLLNVWKGVYKR